MKTRFQYQERSWLCSLILFVVLGTCVRVWVGPISFMDEARAQIPDAGLQRKLLVAEAMRTSALLTEIRDLLKTHTLNVRIQGADNQADTPTRTRGGAG